MHTTVTRKIWSTENKCTIKNYKMLKIFVTDISLSKFILSVSNFARQRLNSFKVLALVSLFVKLFHAIAPL